MRLPNQSVPVMRTGRRMMMVEAGVTPSFCTPCVLGKQICGLPFSPHVEDCPSDPVCSPCIPFINKRVCCDLNGCSLGDCG